MNSYDKIIVKCHYLLVDYAIASMDKLGIEYRQADNDILHLNFEIGLGDANLMSLSMNIGSTDGYRYIKSGGRILTAGDA